jgi:HSP20 family protein
MFARTFWDEFSDFRRSFDQLFDSFYSASRRAGDQTNMAFAPVVETGWDDDFLNLRVVVPGVRQEELKITVQGSQLVLQGERKVPKELGKETRLQMPYGTFERTLELPGGLDLDKMQAHLHDGVLDIRIPVASASKPKQIQITAGEGRKSIAA